MSMLGPWGSITDQDLMRAYMQRCDAVRMAFLAEARPGTPPDELCSDLRTIRALAERYGANTVEWVAKAIGDEPMLAEVYISARRTEAEIARRLDAGEPMTGAQICAHTLANADEQTPECTGYWIDHVLARAEAASDPERGELARAAVRLLGRLRVPCPRDDHRWQAAARLVSPTDRVALREMMRQGVM